MMNSTATICENGHVIDALRMMTQATPFCTICGAKTLSSCEGCGTPIRGGELQHVMLQPVPNTIFARPGYCHNCSQPYPWTAKAIQSSDDLLDELFLEQFNQSGLSDPALREAKDAVTVVFQNTPASMVSAMRLKRIITQKIGPQAMSLFQNIMTGVVSSEVANILFTAHH